MQAKRVVGGTFVAALLIFGGSLAATANANITGSVLFLPQLAAGYNGYGIDSVVGNAAVGLVSETADPGYEHAVIFTSGAMVDLNPAGYSGSEAIAASINGQQVGHAFEADSISRPFLWNGSASSFVDLSPAGLEDGEALGIFGTQQVGVVTSSATGGNSHAVLWNSSAASMVDLNPVNSNLSQANATDGMHQVGFANIAGVASATLWTGTANSVINLQPAGYEASTAAGVGGGQEVGMAELNSASGFHAMMWSGTAASAINLDPNSPYFTSEALATNGVNQVGFIQQVGGQNEAVAWAGTANSIINLQNYLPSNMTWYSSQADYIGPNGTVYGSAVGTDGEYAVTWSLPEPSVAAALLGAVALRRSRRGK